MITNPSFPAGDDEAHADEARRWVVRLASGDMTEDELAAFRRWRSAFPAHNNAFERERALWRALSLPAEEHRRRRGTWHDRGRRQKWSFGLATVGGVAACVVLVSAVPALSLWYQADRWTGAGIQTMALADGTKMVLDADSAVSVHYGASERRVVLLRGNAWFEVRHDGTRPFRVETPEGVTEDVGTAFELRRGSGSQSSVAVAQGAVDVRMAGSDESRAVRLRAGDALDYGPGYPGGLRYRCDADAAGAWARGIILLDNASVAGAVRTIARYRRSPVWMTGAAGVTRRISGTFRIDQPDEAISAIAVTAGLTVSRLPGGILLLRKS